MSFTAEVKDELSRVEPSCELCDYAQLAALIRVCGTLSFRGPGRYSLKITTETGAVASSIIKLTRRLFDLENRLTARKSLLHKKRNYLIEVPEQAGLEEALVRLGILSPGAGLQRGIASFLVERPCCKAAFIRGAFMSGGFIADPRGDFHLEIAVTGYDFARDLITLIRSLGISSRLNHRRGAYAIYIKNYEDIVVLLEEIGAKLSPQAIRNVRQLKEKKNIANRQRNADMANVTRTTVAAQKQLALIDEIESRMSLQDLPPALREFCDLRRNCPELSLAELGEELAPPVSKSGMYNRLLRLEAILEDLRLQEEQSASRKT